MLNNVAKYILDNMPFPVWIKDLKNEFLFANNEFEKIYGNNNSDKSAKHYVCEVCNLKNLCDTKIKEVIKSKKRESFEIQIGQIINKCYITPYFDEDKKLLGVIGVLIDITDSKENQIQIEESENILRTIIDTFPDYIFYKDKDCRYVGYNKKWKEHYNKLGVYSMIGKTDLETGAIPPDLAELFINQDKEIIKSKIMKISEHIALDENGKKIIQETRKVPVIDENGEVWGIVGLSCDVTEKIEMKEKLVKLSYTDSLTGVYNRACFEEKKEELNIQENLPIGVIMGDVNGLKVVNDTFGHLEGDRLLKTMARVLEKSTSKKDYIFRWGGDEFIILMPNCNETKCESIVEAIIRECRETKFNLIDMSISIGTSIKKNLAEDIYENLKDAEEKLYRQKFLSEKSIRSSIIFSLSQSLHEKNVETEEHTKRLVKHANKIGKKLGFTIAQLDELELATKLHDIGKIGVSEEILLKTSKLTDSEFKEIKTHTERGYRILQASGELSHIARSVLTHHERYDGGGYPLGLKGDEIPIMARIVNIVDSYDAMISDRGYNKVKSKEEAILEIIRCRGGQFDPKIADLFVNILENEN